MSSKLRLILLGSLAVVSLTACGNTYNGGGNDATDADLASSAKGTVTFSGLTPTRTEVETAIGEVIVNKSRELTQLPHAHPLFSITCKDIPPLEPGVKLPCRLTSDVTETRYKDFTVELTELSGTQGVLTVDANSYWAYLNETLG